MPGPGWDDDEAGAQTLASDEGENFGLDIAYRMSLGVVLFVLAIEGIAWLAGLHW